MQTCDKELTSLADADLVGLAKQGDHDAFDELIRRHRRRCLMTAISILRNAAEAEEQCQDGFCKAYTHLEQFQGNAEFLTWLLRIIENQCLMLIRRKGRVQFVHLDDVDADRETCIVQLRSPEADPEDDFRKREMLSAMRVEIRRIPPLLRQALLLGERDEIPMPELAVKLGISVPAAKSRLLRARRELRLRMLRHDTLTGARYAPVTDHNFRKYLLLEMKRGRTT